MRFDTCEAHPQTIQKCGALIGTLYSSSKDDGMSEVEKKKAKGGTGKCGSYSVK